LEKTSKIVKSNHQPITTMPATPCKFYREGGKARIGKDVF